MRLISVTSLYSVPLLITLLCVCVKVNQAGRVCVVSLLTQDNYKKLLLPRTCTCEFEMKFW